MRNKNKVRELAENILVELVELDNSDNKSDRDETWITIESIAGELYDAARAFPKKKGK